MKWYGWLGFFLTGIGTLGLAVTTLPASGHLDQISFSSQSGITGTLQVTQTDKVRLGDKTEIRLQIKIDQTQNSANLITFQSKLELDNMEVKPRGMGTILVDPTKPVELGWRINPHQAGETSGTLWLFVNTDGDKELILARPIQLTSKTILGFSSTPIKVFSCISLISGIVIILSSLNKTRSVRLDKHI